MMRILIFASAPLLFAICATSHAAAGSGDLNGDGMVTTTDLNMLRDYLLGKITLTAAQQTQADVNGDSQIHIGDIVKMLNQKPVVNAFAIDNGATTTLNLKVTLNNACSFGPYEYITSESPSFSGASWKSYSTAPEFMLSAGDGAKTVWFKTRNVAGTSGARSDTITLSSQTLTLNLPGGVPLVLVKCLAGSFQMGRAPGEQASFSREDPRHQVTLTKAFYLGKYEVTKRQWQAVMGTTPWSGQSYVLNDLDSPAIYISWNDIAGAGGFMEKLNQYLSSTGQTPATVRLPSEAEWEYACRAGTTTRFYWGDDSSYGQLGAYAWYDNNAYNAGQRYAHVVGGKQANAWGLFDMSGNVWEWCQDWWADNYASTSVTDPTGPTSGSYRVLRGGDWSLYATYCRSACRDLSYPYHLHYDGGFRLARTY